MIQLLGQDYTEANAKLELPRNTYDECVDFISSELALSAQDLPLVRSDREIAQVTRGAALGLRAKVLLYAASPLFNGNEEMTDLKDNAGKRLIPMTRESGLWPLLQPKM